MNHHYSQKLKHSTIFLFSLLFYCQFTVAQCTNATIYGGTGAPIDEASAEISNCNYAGEQAIVNNIIQGNDYVITSSNCLDYITVYNEAGDLAGSGSTPFSFTASANGAYNIHFNTDENCGTEGACRATMINCISCGATPGCTAEVATNYDENATYDDCSCILPNLPNDDCAGAISLDPWLNTDGQCMMTNNTTYSGATSTLDEVSPSVECSDGDLSPKDVWYSLTVPASGVVAFKFMSTPGFSSVVECYNGTCGALIPYSPMLCNNEEERTYSGLTPGSTIYFRVWDYGSNDIGNHEICVKGEIIGCTDPQALNYNPDATFDDGSCNFPSASKPCTASILTVNGDCVVGDNTGLGMEAGEPAPNCFSGENNAVWYKFIAQSNYTSISTDFTGYTSSDTEIALYQVGSCFNYATYEELACDQDGGVNENYNSVISNITTAIGQVYYIQISGWNGSEGTFCIQVSSPPANDEICGAEAISCGDTKVDNTGLYSFSDDNMPLQGCGTFLTSPNAYYLLNGTGNDVHLSLCNSSFDTKLNVYCLTDGTCTSDPSFTCVGSNDDSPSCPSGTKSELSFATAAGGKYYIMVHGYASNTGSFELNVSCSTPVIAPVNQDCVNDGSACREMGTAQTIFSNNMCTPVTGTTIGASSIIRNPDCVASAYQTYSSVWYMINSADQTAFEIELEGINTTDVRFTFHEACNIEPMFCDESSVYGLQENTNYYIRVFTPRTEEGQFTICAKPLQVCAFLSSPSGSEAAINETLEWSSTPFADGYKIMIGTTSGGDDYMQLTDVGNVITYSGLVFDYNTTYYVTIIPYEDGTDINTCPGFSFTTSCPLINMELMSLLENNCEGTNDGGIDIAVAGGVGPYSYDWEGPNGYTNSTEDIVQVGPGVYILTVYDMDNGCETQNNFTISAAEPMTAEINTVGQACANDGSAEVVPTSGEAPYTYFWNNGATTAQIQNMPAGTYDVVITDATGCSTLIDEIVIENNGGINATVASIEGVGCGTANGSITLSPMNGEAPYSYSWISLNGNTQGIMDDIDGAFEIEELPLGTYNITVTDANGCNGLINLVTVPVIGDLAPAVMFLEDVTCFNNTNGMIEVAADFGSAPFQFNWSNGVSQMSQTGSSAIQDLGGGNYGVTITDANGCVGTKTGITVFEPNSLNLSISDVDDPICFGDLTGGVKTFVEGGVPPYSYAWSNGSTSNDLINAGFGTYTLTVTDQNGCEALSFPVNISSATEIQFTLSGVSNLACFGDDNGVINMNVFGGNPPYNVQWNNGATTANLSGLAGGDYECTIIDSKGCSMVSSTYSISTPSNAISLEAGAIDMVSCPDMTDGNIDLNVSGGTAPYLYNWSNGANTEDLNEVSAGNYLVTITDANDCMMISEVFFVGEPDPMSGISTSTVELDDQQDGSATVEVSGGTLPYDYQWDAAAGNQTEPLATNLAAGSYTVTVSDANGCLFVTTVEVGSEETPVIIANTEAGVVVNRLELFPNPTSRDAQLLIDLSEQTAIDINIFDLSGKNVIGTQRYETKKLLTMIDLSGEADGVYLIKVNIGGAVRTLLLVKQQ